MLVEHWSDQMASHRTHNGQMALKKQSSPWASSSTPLVDNLLEKIAKVCARLRGEACLQTKENSERELMQVKNRTPEQK